MIRAGTRGKEDLQTWTSINMYLNCYPERVAGTNRNTFAKGGYKVNRVSVEKVLVGGFREVPFYQGKMYPGGAL